MNEFITEFNNSKFLNFILEESPHPVKFIYITGSRLVGIIDDRSDYDIICVIEGENVRKESEYFIKYEDKLVHWIYISHDRFFQEETHYWEYIGQNILKNLTEEHLLYVNDRFKEDVDKFIENKELLSFNGRRKLIKHFKNYIENIIEDGYIKEERYSKMLYHLCLTYYYENNIELEIEFLKELKRIRWQPVQEQYKIQCFEIIKWLKENIVDKELF
jgi:hypothetical protein